MNSTTITAPLDGHRAHHSDHLVPVKDAPMFQITSDINRSIDVDPREPDSPDPPDRPGPRGVEFDRGVECDPDVDIESRAGRRAVARCADGNGTLTGLFFSDHVADIARAKAMCGLCAIREACLAGALEREEPWGVWGGELLAGGRIVLNKRPCGRPPKRPRPEVVYDEMGPVGVVA